MLVNPASTKISLFNFMHHFTNLLSKFHLIPNNYYDTSCIKSQPELFAVHVFVL